MEWGGICPEILLYKGSFCKRLIWPTRSFCNRGSATHFVTRFAVASSDSFCNDQVFFMTPTHFVTNFWCPNPSILLAVYSCFLDACLVCLKPLGGDHVFLQASDIVRHSSNTTPICKNFGFPFKMSIIMEWAGICPEILLYQGLFCKRLCSPSRDTRSFCNRVSPTLFVTTFSVASSDSFCNDLFFLCFFVAPTDFVTRFLSPNPSILLGGILAFLDAFLVCLKRL